jgi:hypothetical protein
MSKLTDFFPATGGSGLYFGSPREIPCTWRTHQNVFVKTASATHIFQTSEDNTYVELTNITNANGGVFHGAISPASIPVSTSYSAVIDFKITIDGTEYIVSGDTNLNPIGNSARALIGNFPIGNPSSSTTYSSPFSTSNNYYAYVEDVQYPAFQYGPFTFININDRCFVPAWLYQMGGVKFNETLKVEIKTKEVQAGDVYYQSGYSLQTLY